MDNKDALAAIDALLEQLKTADWKAREALSAELRAAAEALGHPVATRHLEHALKSLPLEARWEVEEVIEALTPPPPPPEEPEQPEEEDDAPDDGQLRASDLKEVYNDPRGLILFTDKSGKRWFAQQVDPRTGQPVMFELPPHEIDAVRAQLKGSPYWNLGSGVVPR